MIHQEALCAKYTEIKELFPQDTTYKWNRHASALKQLQELFGCRSEQFKSEQASFKFFSDPFSALKLVSLFGSSYICEQVFSIINLINSHLRTGLTGDNMYAMLRVASTSLEPNSQKLVSQKHCNISH
ncbi:SCND3 protein, partial [Polyodon spathula]|nr:SCND3 protein [Polyodon spathula]